MLTDHKKVLSNYLTFYSFEELRFEKATNCWFRNILLQLTCVINTVLLLRLCKTLQVFLTSKAL